MEISNHSKIYSHIYKKQINKSSVLVNKITWQLCQQFPDSYDIVPHDYLSIKFYLIKNLLKIQYY